MSEEENKTIYEELSELMLIAIEAINDSSYSSESKTNILQMLAKAKVPIVWSSGERRLMPLGHVFKKAFENIGITLTEYYRSFSVPKESDVLDDEGMMPDDDKVNHPTHYQSYNPKINIECIDAMRAAFGDEAVAIWCKLNAFKYNWRSDSKGKNVDIEKAIWYLNKYLELEK